MKKALIVLALLISAFLLQGCIAQMVMRSQDQKIYSEYVVQTQQLNFEREKAKLPPEPIMTFQEWRGKKRP